jgi:uncharacterized membrane protein
MVRTADLPSRVLGALRRAFSQFLALPLAVVFGFLTMTAIIYKADQAWSENRVPAGFSWLGQLLGDSTSLATLLSTIASSIITVTSITFSLLLIALQQGSSALTTQVTDQFLMRRVNQFYFGYFVGLSLFVLFSLATASSIHRPVFGTALSLLLTSVALCMIVVMIYNTIDQMRPSQIIRAIHRHVLRARAEEVKLLSATRRRPRPDWSVAATLNSTEAGHVLGIDVQGLKKAVQRAGCGEVETQLSVPLGRYVAFGDPIAVLRTPPGATIDGAALDRVGREILAALDFDDDRDLKRDPSYGIDQLAVIGWTSISTAKSNPNPGQAVVQSLRDIISRWCADGGEIAGDAEAKLVIEDAAPGDAMAALEQIILVTSESMQAQTLADALRTVAILMTKAPDPWRAQLADIARRALSSLGEHVLTSRLEIALDELVSALRTGGHGAIGESVRAATAELATTLGVLHSRSTRVPPPTP